MIGKYIGFPFYRRKLQSVRLQKKSTSERIESLVRRLCIITPWTKSSIVGMAGSMMNSDGMTIDEVEKSIEARIQACVAGVEL